MQIINIQYIINHQDSETLTALSFHRCYRYFDIHYHDCSRFCAGD